MNVAFVKHMPSVHVLCRGQFLFYYFLHRNRANIYKTIDITGIVLHPKLLLLQTKEAITDRIGSLTQPILTSCILLCYIVVPICVRDMTCSRRPCSVLRTIFGIHLRHSEEISLRCSMRRDFIFVARNVSKYQWVIRSRKSKNDRTAMQWPPE